MDDHPDPTGPDAPEEPSAAHDGEPTDNGTGSSIADQATDPAPEEEVEVSEPPMRGDGQLSLGGLGLRRSTEIESAISIMSARRPIDGRLDPEKDHVIVLRVRAHGFDGTFRRSDADSPRIDGATVGLKWRPLSVRRVPPELEEAVHRIPLVEEDQIAELASRINGVIEEYLPEDLREGLSEALVGAGASA